MAKYLIYLGEYEKSFTVTSEINLADEFKKAKNSGGQASSAFGDGDNIFETGKVSAVVAEK